MIKTASAGAGAEEDEGDIAAAGGAVSHSHANHSRAQAQASSESKMKLLAPSSGSAVMARDGDRDVGEAGFSSMPRKLATIVSGEPVRDTPTAEEMQNFNTQPQGLSNHA